MNKKERLAEPVSVAEMDTLDEFMLLKIIGYLKPAGACMFGAADKRMREAVKSHRMWYHLFVQNRMKPTEYVHNDGCKGKDCSWAWTTVRDGEGGFCDHRCTRCCNRIWSYNMERPGPKKSKFVKWKKHADSVVSKEELDLTVPIIPKPYYLTAKCNHVKCYCYGTLSYCGVDSHWRPSRYTTFKFVPGKDYHSIFLADLYDLKAWVANPGKDMNIAQQHLDTLRRDLEEQELRIKRLEKQKRKAERMMQISDSLKCRKKPRKLDKIRPLPNVKATFFELLSESESGSEGENKMPREEEPWGAEEYFDPEDHDVSNLMTDNEISSLMTELAGE